MLWILEEWRHEGCLYLLDPLNNGVYSYRLPSQAQGSPGLSSAQSSWPQPVGLLCGGTLLATPPRQVSAGRALGGSTGGGDMLADSEHAGIACMVLAYPQ
jgi:hypothetical protein